MRIFAHTVLFCAAVATDLRVFEDIYGDESQAIHRVQSQEECDIIFEGENYVFDEEACTCFSLIQCRIECPEGLQLDPTQPCECISEEAIDRIYNHSLDEQCQVPNLSLEGLDDLGFVNIFIFNAPIYGDIYGVADGILCADGNLEACHKIEGNPTEPEPATEPEPETDSGNDPVTEVIVDPLPVEPTEPELTPETSTLGYYFTPFDDQECRDNFLMLEQMYQDAFIRS